MKENGKGKLIGGGRRKEGNRGREKKDILRKGEEGEREQEERMEPKVKSEKSNYQVSL